MRTSFKIFTLIIKITLILSLLYKLLLIYLNDLPVKYIIKTKKGHQNIFNFLKMN